MRARMVRAFLLSSLFLFARPVLADNMIMAHIPMRAEIVLEYVKSSVEEHGYSVAHVQLCDGGMKDFGYASDFYRVVFFGKVGEVRMISEKYPEFVSYLPLKIAVIAEKNETLLTALDPEIFAPYFPEEELDIQFGRWQNDLLSIFEDVRRAASQHLSKTE